MSKNKSSARDMTSGSIVMHLIMFALPMLVGNVFQLLYNTVDTWVVGKFVSTEALAAVGSTAMIINVMVFFFNGLSIGASVVIGQYYGAKDMKSLHEAVQTTMAMTLILGVAFTIIGVLFVRPMLAFMSTPEDVVADASVYLRIYMAGISGLMIYNMGSGILRAVGDTARPLFFLVFTSIINIILDLFLVLVCHLGIAGVSLATIISQFISAFLVLLLLTKTDDIYRITWKNMRVSSPMLGRILNIGMPTAIQSTITSFSNVFVQSYINYFGSAVMAGWSCYNKLDQFAFIPLSSFANAGTTFVSQNIGADDEKRANKGTIAVVSLALGVTLAITSTLFLFSNQVTSIFSDDPQVIQWGASILRLNIFFLLANCVNHTLAGALRGRGDAKGPMIIMLTSFVVIRQIYLFVMTHFITNNAFVVAFGYPVGWTCCCIIELIYFFVRYNRRHSDK